jgi:hypothetical protein
LVDFEDRREREPLLLLRTGDFFPVAPDPLKYRYARRAMVPRASVRLMALMYASVLIR